MYVEVAFKRKNGTFSGAAYTYNCTIPVKTGDMVLAPTTRGETPAKVVGIGVPFDEINPAYRDNLSTITKRMEPELLTPEEEEGFSLFEGDRR